jgi:hypothetical protein
VDRPALVVGQLSFMKLAFLWSCALVIAASLLVATDYRSRDPDSSLYARLSGDLAQQPASRWIAPEWRGAWNFQGLFREHPVGILIPSVLLVRAGVPGAQAAYIVNMLYQAAVIALIPLVAGVLVSRMEARSLAWVLQLLPVSFVYRIRGNQEHPLLMCFLALIYSTHRARANPWWVLAMTMAFCFLVLVKGAFAMFALVGAALWLVVVPAPQNGSNRWAWAGLAAAVVTAALMMAGYEALYVRTTGESFLEFYRATRLSASMRLDDLSVVPHALVNVGWYLLRLAWFAAPWSFVAGAAAWVWLRFRTIGASPPPFDEPTERGLIWALLLTAVFISVLSPALVRAERFIFPTYFVIGAVGVVTAIRTVGGVRSLVVRADRYDALPIAVWMVTFLLSLGSKVLR